VWFHLYVLPGLIDSIPITVTGLIGLRLQARSLRRQNARLMARLDSHAMLGHGIPLAQSAPMTTSEGSAWFWAWVIGMVTLPYQVVRDWLHGDGR
jgi:hypothetical protein